MKKNTDSCLGGRMKGEEHMENVKKKKKNDDQEKKKWMMIKKNHDIEV